MRFSIYGLPQFPISATEVFLRLHLLVFLTQVIKLSGEAAGIIVSLSLIVSSFFDPLIGQFSDRIKKRTGAVKPFIIFSLISLCCFLSLLFIPSWSPADKYTLFFLVLGYQVSYSSFLIPYLAIAKELIQKEEDIVTLYAWRYFFGSLGALIGVSLPFLKNFFDGHGFLPMGVAMILLIMAIAPASLSRIKEDSPRLEEENLERGLFKNLWGLLKNHIFLGYYLTFTILSIGLGINQTLAVYYYKFGLNLNESEVNILLAVYMLIFCGSIPFWVNFAKKQGKKRSLSIGLSVMCLVTLIYPFLPARNFIALYALIGFAGIFTGIVALIDSYLSNVIDYHTFKKSEKQANLIFGVWRISDKLSRALGIYIAGLILHMTINANNPVFNIKQAFGYGVFTFLFMATLIFLFQKYSDHHHDKVIRILKKKNPNLLYKASELET